MKHILIIGAGRSASSLIHYLLDHSEKENWKITVSDISVELARTKIGNHPNGIALALDITNSEQRHQEISKSDIVVSMLPASMHLEVAKDCLLLQKPMVTASYVSPAMASLDAEAKSKGVLLLNECGLDPQIDHMSAMKIIDSLNAIHEKILSFSSYCGGLVAPESNDNPWKYKFTWNPRNVVLAGQGGDAQFLENGIVKHISYDRLFLETSPIHMNGLDNLEGYANRDSLSYRIPYGLESVPSILRGTLRSEGYCKAWNALIRLHLTDEVTKIEAQNRSWLELITALNPTVHSIAMAAAYLGEEPSSAVMQKLEWLELFTNKKINPDSSSPASALQFLLEEKWQLKQNDKDMVLMQHEFMVEDKNKRKRKIYSSLMIKGKDSVHTAMAMTVGLPLAVCVKLILQEKIKMSGVLIPTHKEIYEPVLIELEHLGIKFVEKEILIED